MPLWSWVSRPRVHERGSLSLACFAGEQGAFPIRPDLRAGWGLEEVMETWKSFVGRCAPYFATRKGGEWVSLPGQELRLLPGGQGGRKFARQGLKRALAGVWSPTRAEGPGGILGREILARRGNVYLVRGEGEEADFVVL